MNRLVSSTTAEEFANRLGLRYVTDLNLVVCHLGQLAAGTSFNATLTWNREVGWTGDGDGLLDAADSFSLLSAFDHLSLTLMLNGTKVAESISSGDNVQMLYLPTLDAGDYSLIFTRLDGGGTDEAYDLAWAAVPEPGTDLSLALATAFLLFCPRFRKGKISS